MGHGNLKDDAIIAGLTTRCCSAFALIASCWVVLCAQSTRSTTSSVARAAEGRPHAPVRFSRPRRSGRWRWAISSPRRPAYDETRVYFPIEGDRVVAYDIVVGSAIVARVRASADGAGRRRRPAVPRRARCADGAQRRRTARSRGSCRWPRSWRSARSGTTAGWCSRPSPARSSRFARPTATSSGGATSSRAAHAPPASPPIACTCRHRRPHRRAAGRDRRAAVGTAARRAAERHPRARRAALRRLEATTSSTA